GLCKLFHRAGAGRSDCVFARFVPELCHAEVPTALTRFGLLLLCVGIKPTLFTDLACCCVRVLRASLVILFGDGVPSCVVSYSLPSFVLLCPCVFGVLILDCGAPILSLYFHPSLTLSTNAPAL
uniref:Uncharacterized protein n=1 Tax=Gasterosteus aculeatus TaxID=69293 RepID=G3Q1X5_GASAC